MVPRKIYQNRKKLIEMGYRRQMSEKNAKANKQKKSAKKQKNIDFDDTESKFLLSKSKKKKSWKYQHR